MIFRPVRQVDVSVAVVHDPDRGFLVTFNDKWGGYAFPMRKRRPTDADAGHAAAEPLREAVRRPLPRAEARPLLFLAAGGRASGRTGRAARYRYQAFEVDPNDDLTTLAPAGFGCRTGFLTFERAAEADLLTWSTRSILAQLLGDQQVAVAVVVRPGPECLMVRYPAYDGYFPVAARLREEVSPRFAAREAVRRDTGYAGGSVAEAPVAVEDVHDSPRYAAYRPFVFQLVRVTFPGLDPAAPGNALEASLNRSGLLWRWVGPDELDEPAAHDLSPTVAAITPALRRLMGAV